MGKRARGQESEGALRQANWAGLGRPGRYRRVRARPSRARNARWSSQAPLLSAMLILAVG
jgi:hypothetical protein